jgi:uncharacterized secreted repeat protein (TIGR03808 family)
MSINRRQFFTGMTGVATLIGVSGATVGTAKADQGLFSLAELRGTANANELGLRAGVIDDQSRQLQKILDKAAEEDKPVFLPPGNYYVSNIILPSRTRLMGVPGASRLVYSGSGHFLIGENASHIELTGIVADGSNRGLHSYAGAAIRLSGVDHAVIDNCMVLGSLEIGIQIERSKGRIERTTITGAAGECGIYALENKGLLIANNEVSDCANGGILVHRWQNGEDGSIVTGNRVTRIGADNGGTGQWGNGVNVFRAANVMVTNNHISDCAFSAIRSNAGNNVQITSNTCLRSGETAIYSEFEFNGALISSNIVDGGAQGISITNFMQDGRLAVCSGNLVRNIGLIAPYIDPDHLFGGGISVEADTTVTGNVIDNAEAFGIMLGWGPYLRDVIATSNVIRGSKTGIYVSVVEGIGPAHIADNTISGASLGAIVGYRWKEAVTGDLAGLPNSGFEKLTVERNRVS